MIERKGGRKNEGKSGKREGNGESGREREGKTPRFWLIKLDIVSREDVSICTYTLDFELFDLILNKWEGGGEGDGELGSSSDAAMHLLRPVLVTLCLCSSGLMYHTTCHVYWTHIS